MDIFDGHPCAVSVEPGEKNKHDERGSHWSTGVGTAPLRSALEPAVAILTWRTDGPAIRMLLTLRPTFR